MNKRIKTELSDNEMWLLVYTAEGKLLGRISAGPDYNGKPSQRWDSQTWEPSRGRFAFPKFHRTLKDAKARF